MTLQSPFLRAVAMGAVLSLAAAIAPAFGSTTRTAQSRPHDVETRIKTLHNKLGITQEQESLWQAVAQTMRDNDKAMADLRNQQANATAATALDALNNYDKVEMTHADSVRKFITAFQPLYDNMSDAQKKQADAFFRNRTREAAQRHAHR